MEQMIYLGIGLALGAIEIYNHMRIRRLEEELQNFPSPEEVAKEVMKIKMPISALPPEMAESIRQQMKGMPPVGKNKTPSDIYIG